MKEQSRGWRVARAGGNVTNGAHAGFTCLNANNSSGTRNTNTGSHVAFFTCSLILAAWQNTKRIPHRCWYPPAGGDDSGRQKAILTHKHNH